MFSSSVADPPLIREPLHAPVAHLIRGGVVEGIHYGSVVVLGADGQVQFQLGDIEAAFYPRSALKPVQAVAMLNAATIPTTRIAIFRPGLCGVASAINAVICCTSVCNRGP